jgi:potassium efflux system protein
VVEHGSDTLLAEKLLLQAAKDHNSVLGHPAPSVMFKKVGDQGLELDLRLFIPHIDHFVSVKHEMHNAINTAFREAGIRFFAFSHRDIDVHSIGAEVPGGFPVQGME